MSDLYVHIPAAHFTRRLEFLLSQRLQPEIACQETDIAAIDLNEFADAAVCLSEAGLTTVLHAPFSGFHPGSGNPLVRRQTTQILESSLKLAERINARKIVFHPGLERVYSQRQVDIWLEQSFRLWTNYIGWATDNDCIFCIENIYESSPDPLLQLMSAIDSPCFGHVFDLGHWNIFCRNRLDDWLDQMAGFICHLHLHDNHGQADEHLAIGTGTVPFADLFRWLALNSCSPSVTIENHSLQALKVSLGVFDTLKDILIKKGTH